MSIAPQESNAFERGDDFFMDYMTFNRLCKAFAIIIPTFIVWEVFIALVCLRGGKERFRHCERPWYYIRCLAYLSMCVGFVCYGRYAIHQHIIERYNYYGPMEITSTNVTKIIQFERYQHLDQFDIRRWSCPYLNGTAPTPPSLNGEDVKMGFGTCNPDILTGTLQLSWTCTTTSRIASPPSGDDDEQLDSTDDDGITSSTRLFEKTCTDSIVQVCKQRVWGSGYRGAETDEDRLYYALLVEQCLVDNNYVVIGVVNNDTAGNNAKNDTTTKVVQTSPIFAYGDCNTCRVALKLPPETKQQNLKRSGQILFWSGCIILMFCVVVAVRYCINHDDTCFNTKQHSLSPTTKFIPPPTPSNPIAQFP